MKLKYLIYPFLFSSFLFTAASASEFDWLNNLNIKAEADSSGYRLQLATRFKIGNAQVNAVIGNVDSPADAYMILRMGELSRQPYEQVLKVYKTGKNRGWGALAKQLGIKPGSREFHALKQGQDLYAESNRDGAHGHSDKGSSHGKEKPGKKDKNKK